jgi:hypothetical protein
MGTAVLFVCSIALLQDAIRNTDREVDRLYDTTVVSGELVRTNMRQFTRGSGLNILQRTFDPIVGSGFLHSYYAEADYINFFLIKAGEDGNFPTGEEGEFWDEFWDYIRFELLGVVDFRRDSLMSFNDFDKFLAAHGKQPGDAVPGMSADLFDFEDIGLGVVTDSLEVHFAAGFSQEDFVYNDPSLFAPIPVILSDLTMQRRDISLGEAAFLGHYFPSPWGVSRVLEIPVRVIGWHNGNIDHDLGRNVVLIPMAAMEAIQGDSMTYITLDFEVDPALNRDLQFVWEEINAMARAGEQGLFMSLAPLFHDEALRVVVQPIEQNLVLMISLYPVVVAVSVLIGAGLAVLLMLQNARIAAILRVLGFGKTRTRAMMCSEHVIVALVGVIIGFVIVPVLGIAILGDLPLPAILYTLGALTGAVLGAVIVTSRAPLELLQVRE